MKPIRSEFGYATGLGLGSSEKPVKTSIEFNKEADDSADVAVRSLLRVIAAGSVVALILGVK